MYTTSIVLFLLEFVIYYHSNHSQQAGSKPREFDVVPSFTHAASISELGRDPWEFSGLFKMPSDWWFVIVSAQATTR
jgi:hypothetical protein